MSLPVGEVAPAVPAAGLAVASLGALIAFVVCWGLLHSWKATFSKFLQWLAGIGLDFHKSLVHIHWHPFGFARRFDTDVQKWLSQGMALSERAMVRWFTAAYQWGSLIVTAPFHLGEATYTALQRVFHATRHSVPAVIFRTIVRPLDKATKTAIATTRSTVSHLTGEVHALEAKVAHLEHTVSVRVHGATTAVAELPSKIGYTSRQLRRLFRRVSALEKATVGLGAVALVATALGRLGLSWIRCPSLLRMGRRLSCAGFGWLESFFADAFEALLVLDLCRFALAAQQLGRVLVPQLGATLLVQNAVCLGGGASYPSAHDSPTVRTSITLPSAHD